jgi:hypothetical protein
MDLPTPNSGDLSQPLQSKARNGNDLGQMTQEMSFSAFLSADYADDADW